MLNHASFDSGVQIGLDSHSAIGVFKQRFTHWIGLRENLQESPMTFMGKSMVSG